MTQEVTQKKRVSLYIDPKLYFKIKADADDRDRSVNWVIAKLLRQTYLNPETT